MASEALFDTVLRLTFDNGVNEKGEPVFKKKAFSNVKTQVNSDQLLMTAQAIAGLQTKPLTEVQRQDTKIITA
ncbi:DUF1659 domain-containing protein [Peribacillus sp. SCS-155]|uniref:DUF1659 domain-containing protein n=1 Tax=Peribacillus sedimenti TaxID=3115297 RepID=UPI003906BC13